MIASALELDECPKHRKSQKSIYSCCGSGTNFLLYLGEITYNSTNSPPAPATSFPGMTTGSSPWGKPVISPKDDMVDEGK